MTLGAFFPALFVFASSFTDTENHDNEEAIEYLYEQGVIEGYSNGEYRPDQTINRAEFVKILMKIRYSEEIASDQNCFTDVETAWHAKYICLAKSLEIVNGYDDGYFRPENEINLVEALKIILESYDADICYDCYPHTWYEPYYDWADAHEILYKVYTSLAHPITRGEMAQLIYNTEEYYNSTETEPVVETGTESETTVETEDEVESTQYTYTVYETTNEAEGFGWIDDNPTYYKEEPLPIVAVQRENVKVLVPEGYTMLAKAHIEDLITCESLLSNFFGGVEFPEEEILMKIYVSTDGSHQGSSGSGKIIYRRSQESIDRDLENVQTNSPDGFLYESGPTYCANSHELSHAFFNSAPLPSFGNEGLAQFTQKHNQGDIYDHINCEENGYYSDETWNDYSDLYDLYSDDPIDYDTAMCFMEELVDTYDWDNFHSMLARLNQFQTGELSLHDSSMYLFVVDVLEYTYGGEVLEILEKYGIEEEDYAV